MSSCGENMASMEESTGLRFVNVATLFTVLKGTPICAACMRLDAAISDKKKVYLEKVESLMSVLENVLCYLSQTSPEQTLLLFAFLHRHTLSLVLHGDWGKNNAARQHMTFIFKRFEKVASRKNLPKVLASARYLVDLLSEPWSNPTLTKILNGEQCTDEEVMKLIQEEMGLVLIVRLEIMAEARCDLQASRLIEVCLACVQNPTNLHHFIQYQDEIVYIKDIYLILLVRAKNNVKLVNEVDSMGLVGGLNLVRRCSNKERGMRLRKSRMKMADVVANMTLVSAMIRPVTDEEALRDMIQAWFNLHPDTQVLFRLLKNMILNAVSSQHIYLLGQLLIEKFGETEKPLCVEVYIRALTVNLNEIEKYKSNSEPDKIKEFEVQLASGFLLLADYLKEDIITCRECVLTAFSLNPTASCYTRIKDLAIASGKLSAPVASGEDDDCENNQSSINCEKRTSDNQDPGLKIDTGQLAEPEQRLNESKDSDTKSLEPTNLVPENKKTTQSRYDLVSSHPIHISDAQKLCIPQTLCDDLSTVISSARYQVLNWHLEWVDLRAQLKTYILSGKEVRSTEKELKYLNIDYNQFKDWPREGEYNTGIEKGFEESVEESDSDVDVEGFSSQEDLNIPVDSMNQCISGTQIFGSYGDELDCTVSDEHSLIRSGSENKSKQVKRPFLVLTDLKPNVNESASKSLVNTDTKTKRIGHRRKKAKLVSACGPRPVDTLANKFEVPLQFSQLAVSGLLNGCESDGKMSPILGGFVYRSNTASKLEPKSTVKSGNQGSVNNKSVGLIPMKYDAQLNFSRLTNTSLLESMEIDTFGKVITPVLGSYVNGISSLPKTTAKKIIKKPNILKHRSVGVVPKKYEASVINQDSGSDYIDLESIENDAAEIGVNRYVPRDLSPSANPFGLITKAAQKPGYSIVQNDLSQFFPYYSPSKLSDPTVLKSLRMYRAKKSATDSISIASEGGQEKELSKFTPMLNTIDLHPRILSRSKAMVKSADIITIDVDSEPEVIDLVDSEEEDNNKNTINNKKKKSSFDIKAKMRLNFNNVNYKKNLFSNSRKVKEMMQTLGLKSLDMIRPPTSQTTVQVVQIPGLARPVLVSNSNSGATTSMSHTHSTVSQQTAVSSNSLVAGTTHIVPQQTSSASHSQLSNSTISSISTVMLSHGSLQQQTAAMSLVHDTDSNITTVIHPMAQQMPSVSLAQVSNNNLAPVTTGMYTMALQTSSSLAQVRSTTVVSENSSKPTATIGRMSGATDSHSNVTSLPSSSNFTVGNPVRSLFPSSQRQMFAQSTGTVVSRQSPDHALLNPTGISATSTANFRIRGTTPHDLIMTKKGGTNVPIGVVRVERISVERVPSESNQQVPNLAPIKTPVCGRPQITGLSRQIYTRGGVTRPSTVMSSQTQSVVTSSNRQSPSPRLCIASSTAAVSAHPSGRSMPVTAHIQRVGYPRQASPTQSSTSVHLKYVFKEGVLCSTEEKPQVTESDSDSRSVSMVLSSEQIQQLLPKSTAHKDKSTADQDDGGASSQGASLPKFQQAFGRTMYQSNSTANNSPSLAPKNGSSTLNFNEQMQTSSATSDSRSNASMCTVLSKAVQTTNKDSEIASKSATQISSELSTHLKMSLPGSSSSSSSTIQANAVSTTTTASTTTSTTSQIETQSTTNLTATTKTRPSDRTATLSQTPVKIFCKVPVTLANTNLLQGKSLAILKTSVAPDKITQTQVKYEVDSRAKETVIRNNMSALLAAALQAQPHLRQASTGNSSSGVLSQTHLKPANEVEKKKLDQHQSTSKTSSSKNYRKLPVVHQQPVARYSKPVQQVSVAGNNQSTSSSTPVVTIPIRPIRTILTTGQHSTNASQISADRIEVSSEALVSPSTPDDPSGSSLLDQQLKEFESVFNKVKKTSQMKERTNSNTVQQHLNIGQQILLTQPTSSANVEFTNTSTNQTALFQSTSTSTIHDLQGERVSLTFISQPTSGATDSLNVGTSQKITSATPVVVVQSCSKPVASPALSVASQSSSSPAPPSTPGSSSGKVTASVVVKQNKSNKSKTASKTAPTTTLKVSTLPKPQQKPQEDEQTTQRIYAILDKYAEQLRNSPELKNKPAPRRRSNPPTNPSQNSKRKKSTQTKSKLPSTQASSSSGMEMSPGSEDLRTMGSEDSSNGVSQLSQTLNSPQSRQDDPSTPTGGDVSSETSESLDSRDTRIQSRVVLTETSTGQSRTVIVQDNVPTQVLNVDASKLLTGKPVVVGSQTIVPQLVLPNVAGVQKMQIFPVPADGRPLVVTKVPKMYRVHQVTMPRGAAPLLPGAVVLRHMCGSPTVKQVKLPTVSGISTQNIGSVIPSGSHSFTLTHDASLETGDAININLDNAILLNSTSPQSISFVHRSIPSSSYQSQESSSSGTSAITVTASSPVQKTTVAYSTSDLNVSYIKQESGTLSMCSPINVIPGSSSQDCKQVGRSTVPSNLTCITLDDEIEYSATDHRSSEVPTLVIAQSSNEDKRWRAAESSKPPTPESMKKDLSQDFRTFQSSVKTMMSHRTSSVTSLLSKQDRYIDSKKLADGVTMVKEELEIKEEDKPERALEEPELCDEGSVSSDSAGSGRAKTRGEGKAHLLPVPETGSPWPYNVTKIECIVKSESPSTSVKQEDTGSHSLTLAHSQASAYKKKANNVENTIYQMAFKRSDRTKMTSKELERNAAALERDLRLQKSLSEECEDLGVDEPSTSDLFPEAELLLDPDHSSRDSQLDLPSETFSQALHSSSSSDSVVMSPMLPFGKRLVTYRNTQKSQTSVSRSSRFVSTFNPIEQFTEESTSGTVSSTRADSPDCQVICYKPKACKPSSNSDSNSPYTIKSLSTKGSVSPTLKSSIRDQLKWSPSECSTPVNGGGSTASPNHDEMRNSCTSEETQCTQKTSDDYCKDTEVDATTDSDSNIDAVSVITLDTSSVVTLDTSPESKSSFVPIPNPAASSPYNYGGNRSNLKMCNRKIPMKHEIWKSILKSCDSKEDLDSDMSEPDQARISDKRSTTTDEDLQSEEGEARAKNGLGTESEETQSTSDRNIRSTKKRKRSGSLMKCTSSKSKVARRAETQCMEELLSEPGSTTGVCKNAIGHHESSRRSSLRGHIKKNCPCCNGSQEKSKSPTKTSPKTEKLVSVPCPSSSTVVISVNKKKPNNKSIVKSSHITKKR